MLYRIMANIYSTMKPYHLMELLVGTKSREWEWERRHLRKGNDYNDTQHIGEDDEWVMGYWDSKYHGHRLLLIDKISAYSPQSILEIGCNCGPNLFLLAQRFPNAKITGIDINSRAIEKGRELLHAENISNVELFIGKADNLEQFHNDSFDIVFTDAILIYIGRDKIKKVIQEMLRVARQDIILLEQNDFLSRNRYSDGLGIYRGSCWERDYKALLQQFGPRKRITVTRISEDFWSDEKWRETGAIIEARKIC